MDRLEALIAVAHRRLQLRRMLMAIERNPQLLDGEFVMALDPKRAPLKIKKPIELAGLSTFMIVADSQEKAIAGLATRYGHVQAGIGELIGAHTEHVGDLEQYEKTLRSKIEAMVGSNGGDPLDGETGQDGSGQVISSETAKT